jgi:hypothetical protein
VPPPKVEELLIAKQPLGPARVNPADAQKDPEIYSSKPFEWPEHIAVGRVGVTKATPSLVGHV